MATEGLEQAITATRSVLAKVTAADLDKPTPCASWDVRGLINHIVGGTHFFVAGMTGEAPTDGDVDHAAGDFLAAYDQGATAALAAFNEPGALDKMVTLPFGTMPGAALLGMATTDTFAHGWDLAKATGQSTDLAPALAEKLLATAAVPDAFRGPEGAPFGPQQEAPDGATAADRVAAYLGRTV